VSENPTLSTKRKKQTDAGKNIFNDDNKRQQYCTAYSVFRNEKMSKSELMDAVTNDKLREEWQAMPPNKKRRYETKAEQKLNLLPFIETGDIKQILKKTNGRVTWRCIELELQKGHGGTKTI
jgi:hypothetical protein